MSSVLWKIFEIAINYYQGFIQIVFIYKFMQQSAKRYARTAIIFFGFVLGSVITLLNTITIYEGFACCLYILIMLTFSLLSFKDKIIKKIFASVIPFVIVLLVTTVELNIISSIYKTSIKGIIIEQNSKRFFCLLIIQISLLLCFFIILKLFKFSDEYSLSDWHPIIVTLIVSFILCSLLHIISLSISEDQRLYINLSYVVIVILNFVIFYVIQSLYQKNKEIHEMKIFKLREQYMEQFIENANIQYESIRKIRHDIKDQLAAVHDLILLGDIKNAAKITSKSRTAIEGIETFVRTNSVVANTIINSKLSTAAALGIRVSCFTVSDFKGIDELDLCDLLSNTLENAVTACMNMPQDSNRSIRLEISEESDIYYFLVKNSIPASVLSSNPKLETTKNDKINHGLGTAIIKDIANKYNGRYDFYELDNTFCCSVLLKSRK